MATQTLHGQMAVVGETGDVTILHQETSASDVLVNRTTNTNGKSGNSAIPNDVDTIQKLTNKLGDIAFKSSVSSSDLANDVVINNYTTTSSGHALDARAGKDLNDRLNTLEESEYVYIEDSENGEVTLPESEINDNATSGSLTWSSSKINDELYNLRGMIAALDLSQNFYVTLTDDGYNNYTTEVTVEEIEAAYKKGKAIWVIASAILLPLRQRIDSEKWIFSGYISNDTTVQAYDITITDGSVLFTYHEILTKSVIKGIQTDYDEETNTVSFI